MNFQQKIEWYTEIYDKDHNLIRKFKNENELTDNALAVFLRRLCTSVVDETGNDNTKIGYITHVAFGSLGGPLSGIPNGVKAKQLGTEFARYNIRRGEIKDYSFTELGAVDGAKIVINYNWQNGTADTKVINERGLICNGSNDINSGTLYSREDLEAIDPPGGPISVPGFGYVAGYIQITTTITNNLGGN